MLAHTFVINKQISFPRTEKGYIKRNSQVNNRKNMNTRLHNGKIIVFNFRKRSLTFTELCCVYYDEILCCLFAINENLSL